MTIDERELRRYLKRDRRAVKVGAVVTALVTPVLFGLPDVLPVEAFKLWVRELTGIWLRSENPFAIVRVSGGFVGAAVAGWVASEHGSSLSIGVRAAAYGLAAAYVLLVGLFLLYWSLVMGIVPPPLFDSLVVPFIYLVPLFVPNLLGGILGGVTGAHLRAWAASRGT